MKTASQHPYLKGYSSNNCPSEINRTEKLSTWGMEKKQDRRNLQHGFLILGSLGGRRTKEPRGSQWDRQWHERSKWTHTCFLDTPSTPFSFPTNQLPLTSHVPTSELDDDFKRPWVPKKFMVCPFPHSWHGIKNKIIANHKIGIKSIIKF